MDTINILGLVAGTCTTVAFIPQVLQVWRTRSAQDISIGMYSVFIVGVALWLVYGLVVNSMPVVVSNLVTLLLASAVLGMKMWFENRQKNA
ncbi:SemiSWEET transporter [Uliginosibacterium gangwonense]|uniref:SemiSWEET transporter n=1 Tax=Uliginosibacterium gangwonense TaxID=392736 RepID=UPI00035EB80C|nr:SemiSWEET transporter [Uliginosibacterium gangwonense]